MGLGVPLPWLLRAWEGLKIPQHLSVPAPFKSLGKLRQGPWAVEQEDGEEEQEKLPAVHGVDCSAASNRRRNL